MWAVYQIIQVGADVPGGIIASRHAARDEAQAMIQKFKAIDAMRRKPSFTAEEADRIVSGDPEFFADVPQAREHLRSHGRHAYEIMECDERGLALPGEHERVYDPYRRKWPSR